MDYWKEFIAIIGGVIVVWRFLAMNRKFLTKGSHDKICTDRLNLIRSEIKVAVLEALNQWLRENGHKLK